jgi:hypothetical protein
MIIEVVSCGLYDEDPYYTAVGEKLLKYLKRRKVNHLRVGSIIRPVFMDPPPGFRNADVITVRYTRPIRLREVYLLAAVRKFLSQTSRPYKFVKRTTLK